MLTEERRLSVDHIDKLCRFSRGISLVTELPSRMARSSAATRTRTTREPPDDDEVIERPQDAANRTTGEFDELP
jgi:hypothetical protein